MREVLEVLLDLTVPTAQMVLMVQEVVNGLLETKLLELQLLAQYSQIAVFQVLWLMTII
jgi:hypothetical protein